MITKHTLILTAASFTVTVKLGIVLGGEVVAIEDADGEAIIAREGATLTQTLLKIAEELGERPKAEAALLQYGVPRDIPWGSHFFIMARPLEKDWKEFCGSTMTMGREEWRPVMISGVEQGQHVETIGSPYSHKLTDFEFGADLSQPFSPFAKAA